MSAFASEPMEAPRKDQSIWIRHTGAEFQRFALRANNLPVTLATSVCERRDRTVSGIEGYLRLAETWKLSGWTPVLRQGSPALCPGTFWISLQTQTQQCQSVSPRCTIGCLVGEGDVCDQHKQISEGRTELHVEWTHVVLRGGPIISCDLCSYLFPQENGSAWALIPFLNFGWGPKEMHLSS